jgi:hypothetical protein
MSFNSLPYNEAVYNEDSKNVIATGAGTLVTIEQKVAIVGSGTLISVAQEVDFLQQGSGTLITVTQDVKTVASGALIEVAQIVREPAAGPCYPYDVYVSIGGLWITDDKLAGTLQVEFEEGTAASCSFDLRPGLGVQNVQQYFGKQLIVTGVDRDGVPWRIFTGIIDIVDFDVINSLTSIRATDRRKELLEAIQDPATKFGSGYSTSYLIGENKSNTELIEALTSFSPYALDFDAYNNYRYTPWEPAATPNITFNNDTVFRRQPNIELVTRGRIVNQINLKFNYEFTKLHYQQVQYNWFSPYAGAQQGDAGFAQFVMRDGYSLTRRDTILAAIEGTGWPIRGQVAWEALPPAGWYDGIAWLGDITMTGTAAERDENGDVVTDSNGNRIYRTFSLAEINMTGVHTQSAEFSLTNRWSQTISKQYSLTVGSSSSQAVFGTIERDTTYTVSNEYDASRWDDYQGYVQNFEVGDGNTLSLTSSQTHTVTNNQSLVESNIQAAIAQAKTEILKTHRENLVTIQVPFTPFMQLYHTMQVSTDQIDVKAKVKRYTHVIQLSERDSYTEIEGAFYSLGAGGSDSVTTLPSISTPNATSPPTSRPLNSYYGVDPYTSFYQTKDGFFGNRWWDRSERRTAFQEQFRIDTISIPASLTDSVVFPGSSSYDIEVPTDTLTITYTECK